MNYFYSYPLLVDDSAATAWKSQLAEAENTPWLASTLAGRASELFPRFVTAYTELRALPRSARRSIQRRLARSRDLLERAPEWLDRREWRRLRYKLARSLAGAALLLALAQNVQAATITVTTNKPGINDGDGQCSLIEAIVNTNNDAATHSDCLPGSGADTIVLPTGGKHTITGPFTNYHGYTGLPVITSPITIQGNGSKITRKKSRKLNRLIAVASTGNLTLDNVTLSNGVEYNGGAVYNLGTLTITNSTISGNVGFFGGGLFNGVTGNATIDSCTLTKNRAFFGGTITNRGGTLTIANCTITGNRAEEGGGIYSFFGGALAIQNSTITGNRAGGGGGLYIRGGTLDMDNCIVTKNTASGGGMWIANDFFTGGAVAVIRNSTIASNKSRYGAGGILHQNSGGTLTIQNSAISGNRAGDLGGGVGNFFGTMVVETSTISGNKGRWGGAVWNQGPMTLADSTLSQNKANVGGGVYNSRLPLTLNRSLLSGNNAEVGSEVYNWVSNGATVAANDFNLFGANGNSGVRGFTLGATDIVPGVPISSILAPLADNGGPTMTHALVPGSPAIDAVPGADPECTGTDQRGTTRPQGAGCDIGAFEK